MMLALAHHHAAPAFNSSFYVTAAAIIPVLYLALAVQAPAVGKAVGTRIRTDRLVLVRPRWPYAYSLRTELLLVGTVVLTILGIAAEMAALMSLYSQETASGAGPLVLVATLTLLLAVMTATVVTLGNALEQAQQVTAEKQETNRARTAHEEAEPRRGDCGRSSERD